MVSPHAVYGKIDVPRRIQPATMNDLWNRPPVRDDCQDGRTRTAPQ